MGQILTQAGRFKATPTAWSLKENKKGTLQFAIDFKIIAAFDGQWIDWTEYDLEKRAYCYLSKKDGTLNTVQIDMLKEALGWDGDLMTLQDDEWGNVVVQLDVRTEKYNNEETLKVNWINPENYDPGLKPLDNTARSALAAKWGGHFRAIAAPKPAAKPAMKPALTPPARAMAKPAAAPVTPPADDIDLDIAVEEVPY